jgi:hypothetical protein
MTPSLALAGKFACASLALLISAHSADAEPKTIDNIGTMDSGIYSMQISDGRKSVDCLLAIGNDGWGRSGVGYSGLACNTNGAAMPDAEKSRIIIHEKISDLNIGKLKNGFHAFTGNLNGKTANCLVVIDNNGWGGARRGYSGFECTFTNQ